MRYVLMDSFESQGRDREFGLRNDEDLLGIRILGLCPRLKTADIYVPPIWVEAINVARFSRNCLGNRELGLRLSGAGLTSCRLGLFGGTSRGGLGCTRIGCGRSLPFGAASARRRRFYRPAGCDRIRIRSGGRGRILFLVDMPSDEMGRGINDPKGGYRHVVGDSASSQKNSAQDNRCRYPLHAFIVISHRPYRQRISCQLRVSTCAHPLLDLVGRPSREGRALSWIDHGCVFYPGFSAHN